MSKPLFKPLFGPWTNPEARTLANAWTFIILIGLAFTLLVMLDTGLHPDTIIFCWWGILVLTFTIRTWMKVNL